MVVLVTGGSGQLGQSLRSISGDFNHITFHFADSKEADITNKDSLIQIFQSIKPDWCINAAAYTAVDKAESEPEKAVLINETGAKNLAEVCRDYNTILIHISTDFVFDGQKQLPYTESDVTNPQGIYGLTKRNGENAIAETLNAYFIIRTSWLYSGFANNFMKTMLRLSAERDSLNVVNDQIGTPTHAVDLARAIVHIIQSEGRLSNKSHYGIYHYSNEGQASWFEFAKKIFDINQVNIQVNPIPTEDFPTPAKRPKYSVLDKSKFKTAFNISIPNWEDSLQAYK